MDNAIRQYLTKAKRNKDCAALRSAYQLIRESRADGAKQTACFTPDLYVICAEEALQLGCVEISTACIKLYFEGKPVANQFLSRAYLCQGQVKSPLYTGNVEDFENALPYFLKAIEISKENPEYQFMVYNSSLLYFQAARLLLRPGLRRHLVPSLMQVVQALEEVAEPDHSWRAELKMHLVECLVDSGKMKDASSLVTTTAQFVDSYSPHLYPRLFSLLIRHKLFNSDLLTMMEQRPALEVIYKIQALKKGAEGAGQGEPGKETAEEKLKEILRLLVEGATGPATVQTAGPHQSPAPILVADRVALLLELAPLALQLKHQEVAACCLKELKSTGEATVAQCIMMECVQCELNLLKKDGKMKVCSKASVEARLKEMRSLDHWLQKAVRAGDPQAVQAVCATQWNLCLPLLQANLRKRIKAELARVAQALQDVQSMLLEMRCQVHSELAAMEEEEGRLDAALAHMEAALLLDDGTWRERLSSGLKRLHLRAGLSETPARPEDQAAMLMQQARDVQLRDMKDGWYMFVNIGQLLAPDAFQAVLDADNVSKIPPGLGSGPVAQHSSKAQHHVSSVRRAEGHLDWLGKDSDSTERVKLWAALVKLARKQEVWDVCRAACRFCLLYDDGRWTDPKDGESRELFDHKVMQESARDMLRLLAEVCIINAEATLHKLRMEGVQLNSPATPPKERGVIVSEDDPQWAVYRDWIQALSTYVTSNLLRAAELGVEIGELWLLGNSAVYLWNYSTHLLAAGEHRCLLPTFQRLVELFRQADYTGDRALFVLLCDTVARGLIQPLCGPDGAALPLDSAVKESAVTAKRTNKMKKETGKPSSRAESTGHTGHAGLQDVHKALELCDCALLLSNCSGPGESVPIALRRQVVVTWVQAKRLLRHQIGPNIQVKDKCTNDKVSAMTHVLVGMEMFGCANNPSEFSVPSLPVLVRMASECSWSDPVVELQVWCQLAAFCHHAGDGSLLLTCSQNALQLENAAAVALKTAPCTLKHLLAPQAVLTTALNYCLRVTGGLDFWLEFLHTYSICMRYSPQAVNEMLSSVNCLRGLTLAHQSNRDQRGYWEAMSALLSGVRYAEKAGNAALCRAAAKHYWNACLPLTQSPADRQQLQAPLEVILSALATTSSKPAAGLKSVRGLASFAARPLGSSDASNEDDYLTLQTGIYSQLFYIHTDRGDWKSALQVLDKAIRNMPPTRHRLALFKHRVLLRARLGESVHMDVHRFQGEGELRLSSVWHQVALCTSDVEQKLTCYQNAITSLVSSESQWQKASLLLELGEWLYCQDFPIINAQHQIEWAIDILLQMDGQQPGEAGDPSKEDVVSATRGSTAGVQGPCPSELKWRGVRCLENLVRCYTVLAVMTDRTSAQHQLNLLRAYTFVLQMWHLSMATEPEVFNDTKSPSPQPPPSSASKKEKGGKMKETKSDLVFPSTPEEWVRYSCPDNARQRFRASSSCYCINRHTITAQTLSLYYLDLLVKELHSLSLAPLTLPILHLAEAIAHDLLDRESLSDLYRLRVVKTCSQMGVETCSPYFEKLLFLSSVQEQEQRECRKAMAFLQERKGRCKVLNQRIEQCDEARPGQRYVELCAQDVWLDKAEICLGMGLYQAARQLLAEAHLVASELGEQAGVARSLLGLAKVECEEQNHTQALALLEKARDLGGDEQFWYQLTLTTVRATLGQGGQDSHTKVDKIVKQGCRVLRCVLEQQLNRAPNLMFLITSLEIRAAVECIRTIGDEPREDLPFHAIQRLMAACDTLREGAGGFIKLGYREAAAEAHLEHAEGLRILAKHSTNTEVQKRYLIDAFSHMQQAVLGQEEVVLNAQGLILSQEERGGLSLAAERRLQSLRLSLAELSLYMLEQLCAELKNHSLALSRKTSVERALEEYTRSTPDPGSIDQEWRWVVGTVGQVALDQLATLNFPSPDRVETRAHCLSLVGKCQRLLSTQQDPLHACTLWDRRNQPNPIQMQQEEEGNPVSSETVPAKRPDLGRESGGDSDRDSDKDSYKDSDRESDRDSDRAQARLLSAKSAELLRRGHQAQQLLVEAKETLAQAIDLCLQHKLPSSILASASLSMLECHGQLDPGPAGQYLALFQSCRSSASMAEVLRATCADTNSSLPAALLNLHRNLLRFQEENPSSMLKGAEESLSRMSMAYYHLTINPNHLSILGELPPNLRILLLQHTEDGSELYGAFYEKAKSAKSSLACSGVAKVSVCPRALLALQEQSRAFGQETRRVHFKEACRRGREGGLYAPQINADKNKLECDFRAVVQGLEEYLHPILSQFDFSCFRSTQPRDKEKGGGLEKVVPGDYVVLLVDQRLQELPLDALAVLRKEEISSVSRDFSLQLLHSRLTHREEKVKSDGKKETKGGKGHKADQSKAIKVVSVNRVLPPNTFPVDAHNFKYIVDPHNEGNFEGSTLTERMRKTLESHSQHFTSIWEGVIGRERPISLGDLEHLLCKCGGFIYLGMERFMANIPPSKLAALNMSECQMALLFDLVQTSASSLRQSNLDMNKSAAQLTLEQPLETALLLSLCGVRCIALNQWHTTPQRNAHNMDSVLDGLLRAGLTSGQTVHSLRRRGAQHPGTDCKATGSDGPHIASSSDDVHNAAPMEPSAFNCVLFGLPNLIIT